MSDLPEYDEDLIAELLSPTTKRMSLLRDEVLRRMRGLCPSCRGTSYGKLKSYDQMNLEYGEGFSSRPGFRMTSCSVCNGTGKLGRSKAGGTTP